MSEPSRVSARQALVLIAVVFALGVVIGFVLGAAR